MENSTQKSFTRQVLDLKEWRDEAEYRAIQTLKGDLLEDCFRNISKRYHERLHRIKSACIRRANHV